MTHCSRSIRAAGRKQYIAGVARAKIHPFSTTTQSFSNKKPVLGIAREDVNLWERRAPLSPNHVETLVSRKGVRVLVQPSSRRAYSMAEYESAGAIIDDDLSEADVIVGKNFFFKLL